MKIEEYLKYYRKEQSKSQEELAKILDVSFTTINRWETGKSIPNKEKIKLIKKLKVSGIVDSIEISTKKPIAYAFFAGAGGFHLGMEDYFNVCCATDIEESSAKTYQLNWPKIPFLKKNIALISSEELVDLAGGKKPELIFGGPPCQGFSTLGAKLSSDPRNALFSHYVRLVEQLAPKCFLLENVKSLTTMYKGQILAEILAKFSSAGYTVYKQILNSADYGVPQFRERVFIFGTKLPHPFMFPNPTHGNSENLLPFETVGTAIMDLAGLDMGFCENHIPLEHSDRVISRYKLIPEGGRLPSPEELPEEIRRTNFGNTYKRLDRSRPALTMVPGNNAFPIHPTLHRSLTPREAARIQSFPDSHIFVGDRRKQCILVGNAVPPKLATAIGKEIHNHMMNKTSITTGNKPVIIIKAADSRGEKVNSILPYDKIKNLADDFGFIDLFSGAGGFTIGFSRAGWNPLLSVDNNSSVSQTHEANMSHLPYMKADLSDAEAQGVIIEKFKNKNVGIIVGGPPCQGFSIFGKRRFTKTKGYNPHSDPRNKLVYAYWEIINNLKPNWFVMENVPGLANLDDGLFLETLISEFKSIGYTNISYNIINAADYGIPQLRRRLLIIGNRTGHIIPWPKKKFYANPKDWQKPYRTVGEVIADLALNESYDKISCHIPMKHKPLLVERYKYIKEGEKLNVELLPQNLRKGYRTEEVKNYSHVFKRLDRNKPSGTMVPGHNAFPIHPWLDRALTVREAARIQTFPDELEFKGSRQDQCIQVGNAFPPLLAEIIGNCIKKAITNNWTPESVPKSAWYSLIEEPSKENNLFELKD